MFDRDVIFGLTLGTKRLDFRSRPLFYAAKIFGWRYTSYYQCMSLIKEREVFDLNYVAYINISLETENHMQTRKGFHNFLLKMMNSTIESTYRYENIPCHDREVFSSVAFPG